MQHKMSGNRSVEAQTYRTLYSTKHWKTLMNTDANTAAVVRFCKRVGIAHAAQWCII